MRSPLSTDLPTTSATVTWVDADALAPHLVGLDGLAYVEAMRERRLPGDALFEALDFHVADVATGRITIAAVPTGPALNLAGMAHGGYLATLMDSATGYAVFTTLPADARPPHVAASYSFLRAARGGVELRCTAEVLRAGRTVAHVRADVRDAANRLIATGETSHAVTGPDIGSRARA